MTAAARATLACYVDLTGHELRFRSVCAVCGDDCGSTWTAVSFDAAGRRVNKTVCRDCSEAVWCAMAQEMRVDGAGS